MRDVFIVGVGMTPFGRHLDRSVKQLTEWAVTDALADAGCGKKAIEAAAFGNSVQGYMENQVFIRGQIALLPQGFDGIPIYNVENACATASTAFNIAVNLIRAGSADVVMAVGTEKMYSTDKAKMFSVFDSGWDIDTVPENIAKVTALGHGVAVPEGSTSKKPYSHFMDIYAAFGRQMISRYGVTQRQIAAVCSKNHGHSVHNERAQYRNPMTVDEVLSAAPITYPLTLPMCAPISDGAAAAIVCSEDALKRFGISRARAVRVRASVLRSASNREGEDLDHHIVRLAAQQAYEQAGLGPEAIDVAELHDATALGEIMHAENLGLCARGEGGYLAESGATTIGGRIPINPSGGLESKGHPVGATGLGQIYELVTQLRGEAGARQVEGARLAIHENGGGLWGFEDAVAHVGIYERVSQ